MTPRPVPLFTLWLLSLGKLLQSSKEEVADPLPRHLLFGWQSSTVQHLLGCSWSSTKAFAVWLAELYCATPTGCSWSSTKAFAVWLAELYCTTLTGCSCSSTKASAVWLAELYCATLTRLWLLLYQAICCLVGRALLCNTYQAVADSTKVQSVIATSHGVCWYRYTWVRSAIATSRGMCWYCRVLQQQYTS